MHFSLKNSQAFYKNTMNGINVSYRSLPKSIWIHLVLKKEMVNNVHLMTMWANAEMFTCHNHYTSHKQFECNF